MNAAIRAVVRTALGKGLRVRGIRKGYQGLLDEDIIDLTARDVFDVCLLIFLCSCTILHELLNVFNGFFYYFYTRFS